MLRKDIAKILTVINEKRREKAAKKYGKKKWKPIDQRAKKTRAARKQMTLHQQNKKTIKTLKKLESHPHRRYALQA